MILLRQSRELNEASTEGKALGPSPVGPCLKTALLLTFATEVMEIVDLSESINSDSDAEVDNETPIKIIILFYVLHCFKIVKTCLIQQGVNDAVYSFLPKVEKELFRVRNQKGCRKYISQYFEISN
ncbi:hypothetical protein TNCV_3290631 [Trichonephila clavipes]|nr:hypothetical protein TNCV_3290631 [Trichonephila clavipes]